VPQGEQSDAAERPPEGLRARFEAWREGIRRNPVVRPVYRVGVLVLGGFFLVAGVAMLALPGPGWATIFIGLAILASEFAFARRVTHPLRDWFRRMQARSADPQWRRKHRVRIVTGSVVAVVVIGLLLWWYVDRYGLTLAPLWPFE
jgi:uncharacterized protein (TIGR02611 family)